MYNTNYRIAHDIALTFNRAVPSHFSGARNYNPNLSLTVLMMVSPMCVCLDLQQVDKLIGTRPEIETAEHAEEHIGDAKDWAKFLGNVPECLNPPNC